MSLPLLARVRWANVLRLLAVMAALPLAVVAMRGGTEAPSVPSGAVRVAPVVTAAPDVPAAAEPDAPASPRPRPRRRRHRRRAAQQPARPVRPTRPPVAAAPALPTPSRAAEFRP